MLQRIPSLLSMLVLLIAGSVHADWVLDPGASSLYFVSTKAGKISEVHRFRQLLGQVSEDGIATVEIDLASVDTGIQIRDERMREHLFQTTLHPRAHIRTELDLNRYRQMPVGAMLQDRGKFAVTLHGVRKVLELDFDVTRLGESRFVVESRAPIVIGADLFELGAGLDKLQALAGLSSITPTVPVTFRLSFEAR